MSILSVFQIPRISYHEQLVHFFLLLQTTFSRHVKSAHVLRFIYLWTPPHPTHTVKISFGGFLCVWLIALLQCSMWRNFLSNRGKLANISAHRAKQKRHQLYVLRVHYRILSGPRYFDRVSHFRQQMVLGYCLTHPQGQQQSV